MRITPAELLALRRLALISMVLANRLKDPTLVTMQIDLTETLNGVIKRAEAENEAIPI